MKQYKTLLFDADGTLFDYDQAESTALMLSMKHFGLNFVEKTHISLYREINKELWQDYEKGNISSIELRTERFERFFRILEKADDHKFSRPATSTFSELYLKHLGNGGFLITGAKELLEKLNGRYRLVLITNGMANVQYPRLERSGLKDYFDKVVVSEEVGSQKPEPDIFRIALNGSGAPLQATDLAESIIIGDSLTSDILGGLRFGIDTCWFNPAGLQAPQNITPHYTISALDQLVELLDL